MYSRADHSEIALTDRLTQIAMDDVGAELVPQAVFRVGLREIEGRAGVRFAREADDLDTCYLVAMRLEREREVPRPRHDYKLGFASLVLANGFGATLLGASLGQSLAYKADPLTFVLQRHLHEPDDEVTLLLPQALGPDETMRAVERVAQALSVSREERIWDRSMAPDL